MSSKIKVGDKAPDFTLPDTEVKPVSLKQFRGQKVVFRWSIHLNMHHGSVRVSGFDEPSC
jgi:peroxiredoxin